MKQHLLLIFISTFYIIALILSIHNANGAEIRKIDITSVTINFNDSDAIVTVNYNFNDLARLYLMLLGSKSIEPKLKDIFYAFDYDIIRLNYDRAILRFHNVSRLSGKYYLHDSTKFNGTIKVLYIIIPGSRGEGIFYDMNATPNIFYMASTRVATQISISIPVQYVTRQRNSMNQAQIRIAGTYGGNVSSVEASFNGSAYQMIAADVTGGTYSGNLAASVGQGTLTVRVVGTNTTASVNNVGIGDVFVIAGQSSTDSRLTSPVNLNVSNPFLGTVYTQNHVWKVGNDPIITDEDTGGHWGVRMMDCLIQGNSVPVSLITTVIDNASIASWQKGQANYNQMAALINEATDNTGDIKAIIWYQGESDAMMNAGFGDQGNYTDYKTKLEQFGKDVKNDFNTKTLVVNIPYISAGGTPASNDNIRRAQFDAVLEDPTNLSYGGFLDGNIKNDVGGIAESNRIYHYIQKNIFGFSNHNA